CLLDLRGGGPKFVVAVRQVLSELGMDTADGVEDAAAQQPGPQRLPGLAPGTFRAFQITVAWAVAEAGARTAGDLQ
ncbi:MAG: hypothetical protein ACHP9Z_17160, partial [Streptosporangiales bacterium]